MSRETGVPGRQPVVLRGLSFKVSPHYWLRRLTHFPFFFESHNASFQIEITRVTETPSGNPWPNNEIPIDVVFSDGSNHRLSYDVPELKTGEKKTIRTPQIYVQAPGQTKIRIPLTLNPNEGRQEWESLYSYHVRSEESAWLAFWAVVVVGVTIAASLLFRPVVNVPVPQVNLTVPTPNVTIQMPTQKPSTSSVFDKAGSQP